MTSALRGGLRRALVATALACAVVGLVTLPARADDSVGRISELDVVATFTEEGLGRVQLDLTYDFGDDEAHGPFLVLAERQEIAGDPDRYRRLDLHSFSAESVSGAPDDLRVERGSGAVQLYIGDPDVEITGAHRYRVGYSAEGLLTPGQAGPDGVVRDELFWNVVAPGGFDIELHDIAVRVAGPAQAEAVACYTGRSDSDRPCDIADGTGDTSVVFAQERLTEGEGLSVVVGWPAGTFPGAEPMYEPRRTWANTLQVGPATGGLAGLVTVLGAGAAVVVASRRGRDQAYLATTPGLAPLAGEPHRVGPARRRAPVAVRFTPPDGVRPGEIGTLQDEVAHPVDVAATLVDLAVRGYLRIEEMEPDGDDEDVSDWLLRPLRKWQGELEPYEEELLDQVFDEDPAPVRLSEAGAAYAKAVAATQDALYDTVTEHGWFAGNPRRVRMRWVGWGLGLLVLGLVVTGGLVLLRLPAVLGLPLVVVGLVVAIASFAAPARTAAGTAVLAQTLGFRQYLATAEANQIRFEEDAGIFSRYLPYAMVFDLTDRWAELLAQVAARGGPVEEPDWYVPAVAGAAWWTTPTAFEASVGAFAAAATSAVTGSTSSGGSGFSGSVGGGGGGMGGGSW